MRHKLYHATYPGLVPSILKHGLKRRGAFVSLSENKKSWLEPGMALLEVDIRGIKHEMHTFLPALDEITVWGDIEPERIKVVELEHN